MQWQVLTMDMNREKVELILGHIWKAGYAFGPGDAEHDLREVLSEYGIADPLTPQEEAELIYELEMMADDGQTDRMRPDPLADEPPDPLDPYGPGG